MTRIELAALFIGVTLLVLGSVSAIAATLRLRRGSTTLLTFGIWCAMYGARLLALQPSVRAVVGGTPRQWTQFTTLVTYTINVPITIFVASLVGAGWRQSIRWVVVGVAAFAIVAVPIGVVSGNPGAAGRANTWVVLTSVVIGLANIVYVSATRAERSPLIEPIVMFGGMVLVLFVLNENLGELVSPRVNIEPIGVLIFILCLGYAVGRSVFRAEAEYAGMQRELETARQIQASLLPRQLPKARGLDVAVRYVPMAAVAGDIYDVIRIGPSTVGILVADVMGHGIPAALVASMVKLAFSMQAEQAHDPAAVLTSMNRVLCGQIERSYVTAVYVVVDTEQHRVTVANAGHPPPLVHRRGEAIAHVECEHGLILGFLPDAHYTNAHVDGFAAGDRILLYSDGVLETRDPSGEIFDAERVARWVTGIKAVSAERFADIALDELTRWSDRGRFDDDVTFVVAEGVAAAG